MVTTPHPTPLPHFLAPLLAPTLALALCHVAHAGWPLQQQGPGGGPAAQRGPAVVAEVVRRAGGVEGVDMEQLCGVLQGVGVLEGGTGRMEHSTGDAPIHALTTPLTTTRTMDDRHGGDAAHAGGCMGGGMLLWGGAANRQGPSAVAAALLCVLPGVLDGFGVC